MWQPACSSFTSAFVKFLVMLKSQYSVYKALLIENVLGLIWLILIQLMLFLEITILETGKSIFKIISSSFTIYSQYLFFLHNLLNTLKITDYCHFNYLAYEKILIKWICYVPDAMVKCFTLNPHPNSVRYTLLSKL